MFFDIVILIAGLALLTVGGDFLVRGAVSLANAFSLPPLFIGLTIVGFGTSAPELVVCLQAALEGAPAIAVGNIVGSNITNILLILGVPALIISVSCNQVFLKRSASFMLIATALFIAFAYSEIITSIEGWVLVILFILYMAYSSYSISKSRTAAREIAEEVEGIVGQASGLSRAIFFTVTGLILLPIAAHLTIKSATDLALVFGISEAVIGLTVVAFGTSLPELASVVAAALHRHPAMIVGNVIGSNVFNIVVMGLTAIITPVTVDKHFINFDLWVMAATALALMAFLLLKKPIARLSGIAFLVTYSAYLMITSTT